MQVPWPNVPSSLFGGAEGDEDQRLNVPLRWFREHKLRDVTAFKRGYREAAQATAEEARNQRCSPDYLVWPIAWLWRHYLELALKDIVARGPQLRDEAATWTWPTNLGHKVHDAWQEAKPFIVEHGAADAPELANVEAVIAEFDKLDPSGAGFRYPLSRNGFSPSLAPLEDWLNIDRIDNTMQKVANFLDAVISAQQAALEYLREVARDQANR